MSIEFLVSSGLAVASFLFAVFSWWSANRSKRARDAATAAAETANRHAVAAQEHARTAREQLEQLREQTAHLGDLAKSLRRPSLTCMWAARNQVSVVNASEEQVRIESLVNASEFVREGLSERLPLTLGPGAQVRFLVLGVHGAPVPDNLVLRVSGDATPTFLPLPPRA